MRQMRDIPSHQINECNSAITIHADERDPKNGNAPHYYEILVGAPENDPAERTELRFQHGPIKEVGTNGITHEVLIAILVDRLEGFQDGPYACQENADALNHLRAAAERLHDRTKARVERGVEGTNEL